MKIIATSIVVLAAAATVSAGESSLRLGRNLKKDNKAPNGGNGKGKAMGYGARCCRNADEDACTDFYDASNITAICNTEGLSEPILNEFVDGFNGCVWTNSTSSDEVEEVCEYADDDRRRELKPGGKNGPNGNGKAKGIGWHCCRPFNDIDKDTCEATGTPDPVAVGPPSLLDCTSNSKFDYATEFNGCVWTVDEETGETECDHVDLDSLE